VADGEDLYPAATNEYLKRNFVAAERLVLKLLAANEKDCPAGLMLAAVWRRTGRSSDAREELARLSRLDAAEPGAMEIERELKLLDEADRAATDSEMNAKDETKAA
jgi:Flp pilus assembly protein TadD